MAGLRGRPYRSSERSRETDFSLARRRLDSASPRNSVSVWMASASRGHSKQAEAFSGVGSGGIRRTRATLTTSASSAYTDRKTWHDSGVVGVPVGIHDLDANDLGVAHVPLPLEIGDLVLLDHSEHRIVDFVPSSPGDGIAALAKVQPTHLTVFGR